MNILEVKNLRKKFGSNEVLKDINLTIGESEILGFLGRNGSGKSTTMKCISGLMGFNSGQIKVCGFDIKSQRIKVLENIGVSIESPALYPNLSGYDHYMQMKAWRDISDDRLNEMIQFANLGQYLKRPVRSYSMGMKMRLMLSLVMMHKPKLLILDEPMNGLDFEAVLHLRQVLSDLKERGSSILISSHQLSELEKISDRVAIIEGGRIVYDDEISNKILGLSEYYIESSDNLFLENILRKKEIEFELGKNKLLSNHISFKLQSEKIGEIIRDLSSNGVYIKDIVKENISLEDLYANILEGQEE